LNEYGSSSELGYLSYRFYELMEKKEERAVESRFIPLSGMWYVLSLSNISLFSLRRHSGSSGRNRNDEECGLIGHECGCMRRRASGPMRDRAHVLI